MGQLFSGLDLEKIKNSPLFSGLGNFVDDLGGGLASNTGIGLLMQVLKDVPGFGAIATAFEKFGLPLTQAAEQQRATDAAKEETEARFEETRDLIRTGGTRDRGAIRRQASLDLSDQEASRIEAQDDLQGTRDEVLTNLGALGGANKQAFDAFSQPLFKRFEDREASLLSELEGLGEVDRGRINRSAGEEVARQQAQLASRGLGNSSLLSSAGTAVERERLEAENDLNERLRRERIGVIQDAGGDTLDARRQIGAAGFDVGAFDRRATINTANQFAGGAFDLNRSFDEQGRNTRAGAGQQANQSRFQEGRDLLNLLGSRNDVGPDQNAFIQFMNQIGGRGAPQVDEPSDAELYAGPAANIGLGVASMFIPPLALAQPLINPAINAATNNSGGGGAGTFTGGGGGFTGGPGRFKTHPQACFDVAENVISANGLVPLGSIQVGDLILGDDGEYRKVIRTDIGKTPATRLKEFVAVTWESDDGWQHAIRMTYDHPIERYIPVQGKSSDDWALEEVLPVELEIGDYLGFDRRVVYVGAIEPPKSCGDLELEGCDGYCVGGLYAVSVIKRLQLKEQYGL